MTAQTAEERRDWQLFDDWCRSHDVDPLTATMALVDVYLRELPVALSTARRRRLAIKRGLLQRGIDPEWPVSPRSTTVRAGEGWATAAEALEQLPKWRYPIGLRGRRDAWLVVACAELGFTRRDATILVPAMVDRVDGHWMIRDRQVPQSDDPARCPACAVSRWLEVIGPARYHLRSEIRTTLMPPMTATMVHRCDRPVDDQWRQCPHLTVAIDAHGWVSVNQPLSVRSVSTLMKDAQRFTGRREEPLRVRSTTGRFENATRSELADAYDDVDARLEALLDRAAAVLEEGSSLRNTLAGYDE